MAELERKVVENMVLNGAKSGKKVVKVKQGLVKKVLKTLNSYMAIDPRKRLKPQGLQWHKRW